MGISNTLTFNAVDVETADIVPSSICQIGIVHVRDGGIQDQWKTLVNPEKQFDRDKIRIHGIDEDRVRNAPTFSQVYDEICHRVRGSVLVSHTPFDRTALNLSCKRYSLEELQVTWLDSARVARRAWSHYRKSGYGLENVARDLGITFKHHDALEDAKVAAKIMVEACKESKLNIQGWIQRLEQPRTRSSSQPGSSAKKSSEKREGRTGAPLFGETVVFTGDLRDSYGITQAEAADLAAEIGCNVHDDITKAVTMLVVGILKSKSGKYRKAEKYGIKILPAEEFFSLIDSVR